MKLFSPKNNYRPINKRSKTFEIVEHSKQRIVPNLEQYVNAIESASSRIIQNRITLYDSYIQTLMIDDIVNSLIEKRLDNITNKQIKAFNMEGVQLDNINALLESPRFLDFIKDLVMVKFWGFSVFEFDSILWNDIELFDYTKIPIKHINPYKKEVLKYQYDENGESYENRLDVLMIGNPDDLGLLSKVTYLSILNRLSTFNWSAYSDLASNNFMMIKSRMVSDDEEIERLQTDYMSSSKKGSMSVPDGVEIDFENMTSSQQNQLFEGYYNMVRERLSILILGNTMTSVDGGSYAQSIVHESEQSKKYTSDEVFVENILNYDFKDYLNIWIPDINTNDIYFKFLPSNDDEILEKISYFEKLKNLGIIFTDEELRNHFEDLLK